MQHRYSNHYLSGKLPGPSFGFSRAIGAGMACAGGVFFILWKAGPHELKHLFPYLFYLFLVSLFALLVVLIRRMFRPPERLRKTVADVNHQGVWRDMPGKRELMMGVHELRTIVVAKSALNQVRHVVLEGGRRSVRLEGFEDMHALVEDLRVHFPRAALSEKKDEPYRDSTSAA